MKFLTIISIGLILNSCGSGTEKNTDSNSSSWQVVQVKDEFGDIVKGESSVSADFRGTMSNSAVVDAALTVRMQIADSTIYSVFHEYDGKTKAQLPNSKYLTIKVKVSGGEVLEVKQFLYKNMMVDNDKELLKILLSQNKPVKVIADISMADKYSSGVYIFEVDPNGLKEVVK